MTRWTGPGVFGGRLLVLGDETVGYVTPVTRHGETGMLAGVHGAASRWSASWSEADARGWVERHYYARRAR